MLELGELSSEEHQKIVDFIQNMDVADIYLVGKEFSKTSSSIKTKKFDNAELLSDYLYQQKPMENQTILIKGSRGIQLEKVLKAIQ